MKIIQSYSQFDDGCQYAGGILNGTEVYLNFYTFLLSYLLLKKHYGRVTMYCNKKAYDTVVRYIPYDEIIIKENHYDQNFWSAYKLSVIEEIKEDFVHIDSDVFMFRDHLLPFNGDFDITVQYVDLDNTVLALDEFTSLRGMYDIKKYKPTFSSEGVVGNNFSCGVVGMRSYVTQKYIQDVKRMYEIIKEEKIRGNKLKIGMILEELTLYLTSTREDYKWHSLFAPVKKSIHSKFFDIIGDIEKRDVFDYTHMWWRRKFTQSNIDKIKNVLKDTFPESNDLIIEYEKTISDKNVLVFNDTTKKETSKFIS